MTTATLHKIVEMKARVDRLRVLRRALERGDKIRHMNIIIEAGLWEHLIQASDKLMEGEIKSTTKQIKYLMET